MAHAVPLLMLPSSVWRFPVAFGFDMGMVDPEAGPRVWWALPYTFGLIAVIELLAHLTVGLVSGRGEVTPHWMPIIGGRRVRRLAAVIPATIGGVLLTALWAVEPILGAFGLFGVDMLEPALAARPGRVVKPSNSRCPMSMRVGASPSCTPASRPASLTTESSNDSRAPHQRSSRSLPGVPRSSGCDQAVPRRR